MNTMREEQRVRIRCARGHSERLVAVFDGVPGIYWRRVDRGTAQAEFAANEFRRPSGINGRHRFVCRSCGLDERIGSDRVRSLLDRAPTNRLTIR